MSKVFLNNDEFTAIQTDIDDAKKLVTEAMDDIWQTNFENLYNNFVTNGFLDDLYEDAESNYHKIMGASGIIIGVGAGATCAAATGLLGTTAAGIFAACAWVAWIPIWGWIIAAAVAAACLIVGIVHCVKASYTPDWKYEARNIFQTLLEECVNDQEVNYLGLSNLETKLECCRLALQSVLLDIAEFSSTYANLQDSADQAGIGDKLALADDGITLTNVNTTITIDGEEVETTVAEAMSAFYTYSSTVTAAEIEAEYLHEKYPDLDIDFTGIVKNANAFMTNTINSDLYSKEFVEQVLPQYSVTDDEAKDAVTGATGLGLDGLNTLLGQTDIMGDLGMYAGLIGTTFINSFPDDMVSTDPPVTTDPPEETPTTPPTSSCSSSSCSSSSCSSSSCSSSSCSSSSCSSSGTTPETTPEQSNTIEIEKIDDTEIPTDEEKFDYGMGDTVDYDKLAREQYEFGTGAEEIAKSQQELLESIEKAYEDGNLDDIKAKLKEYGFSTPEIEAIIADKYQCIKTMLYCDKREILAKKAMDLAKADGVENYDTSYDDKIDYDSVLDGEGANDLLMNASEDETCVKAYETMNTAAESYKKALTDNNSAIVKANENKKTMEDLKTKYEKEFSSSDTTKWSEDAAKEYNEAIKTYNESVKEATTAVANIEAAKTTYTEARTAFETAEKNYYEQIKQQSADQTNGDTSATTEQSSSSTEESSNSGNESTSSDSQNNNSNEVTELTTDNVVLDSNGDITFNMSDTGEVKGATLTTDDIDVNSSTTTDSADQEILNSLNVSSTGIEV